MFNIRKYKSEFFLILKHSMILKTSCEKFLALCSKNRSICDNQKMGMDMALVVYADQ